MPRKKKSSSLKIAIVISRFNEEITGGLLNGALEALLENNITNKNVDVISCPGAFEIPLTARTLLKKKKYKAVICLGAVIKGETAHFEYISYAVSYGIMKLSLEYGVPVTFGVLTCYNDEQAVKRSLPGADNKGREAAMAALDMIAVKTAGKAANHSNK